MTGRFSDHDHELMDKFLEQTFEDVRSRSLGKTDFVEAIAFIVTAVDMGAHSEALRCFVEKNANEPERRLRIVT